MANLGATMQVYLNDLIKNLEEMRDKRDSLRNSIIEEEEERVRIEKELAVLTDRLERITEILARKGDEKNNLEKMVVDTENTKAKLAESFKSLLSFLQKGNNYPSYNSKVRRNGQEDDE